MNAKVCFSEIKSGVFEINPKFKLKCYFVLPEHFMPIDNFCWNTSDGINQLIEGDKKSFGKESKREVLC